MVHLRAERASASSGKRRALTLMSEPIARALEARVARESGATGVQLGLRGVSTGSGGSRRALARELRGGTMFSQAVGRENR